MPTPTEHLTTGDALRPDALRLPYVFRLSIQIDTGDLSPWLPDGGGWSFGDSFALPRGAQFGCYPLDTAGRSRGHRIGGKRASRSPLQPRS